MGIIPDKMIQADDSHVWWQTANHKPMRIAASAGIDVWSASAGFDFTVSAKQAGYYDETAGEWVKDGKNRTLVRDDTKVTLGRFTSRYHIHQPQQIKDFFSNFVLADERFQLSTMGVMKGGALIWALAKFEDATDIVGEKHERFALLGTSYNGMWATFASATAIKAVCQNTIEASIFGGAPTFRVPHNVAFCEIKQAQAAKALAEIAGQFDEYATFAKSLLDIKMTRDQTLKLLSKLVTGKEEVDDKDVSGRTKCAMGDLVDALSLTLAEPSNEGFNGWTAFNAVTRFVDHHRATKRGNDGETAQQARLFSANFGSGASMKSQAVKLLKDLVPA
jgi:phage/plasmid-like protein (TIGR03299 family)